LAESRSRRSGRYLGCLPFDLATETALKRPTGKAGESLPQALQIQTLISDAAMRRTSQSQQPATGRPNDNERVDPENKDQAHQLQRE
jgi:hypothetical protein